MKVLITGGTGLIGRRLTKMLTSSGHQVIITTRRNIESLSTSGESVSYLQWDGYSAIADAALLRSIGAVIHLMGAGVADKRWNAEYKNEIMRSRVETAKNLLQSFEAAAYFPTSVISSSATGYYGSRGEELLTEHSTKGTGFLSDVCEQWEHSIRAFEDKGCRCASIRAGIVLDDTAGAFPKLVLPYRFFIGGKLGNGDQWFSWIHWQDLCAIYQYALSENISGPINAVSPNPVRMYQLADSLGTLMHRPSLFPVPEIMLKIIMGEAAVEITKSQRVFPERLNNERFKFHFPTIGSCIADLLQ